jgi:arsenate reductase
MFKVLFLCTENSCRSQMAEGLVNYYLDGTVKASSAGVRPNMVNPRAIKAMGELGIDISSHRSKSVDEFINGECYSKIDVNIF